LTILPDTIHIVEKELLLQIAAGDERAFTKLFEACRANIYTTALRMTRDTGVAEEILQDVFLKVWLKREELPELQNFSGWLYTVAQNLTFNACKKMTRENERLAPIKEETDLPVNLNAEHLYLEKEIAGILQKAVDRLPDKQRETYILIKEQGMKREDAAFRLHVSPETVKSNLEQAVRSVRAFCMAHFQDAYVLLLFLLFH
jgi:RNA polymerase sigma-70 factor (family 1)